MTLVESHHGIDGQIVPSKVFISRPRGVRSRCQKALYTLLSWWNLCPSIAGTHLASALEMGSWHDIPGARWLYGQQTSIWGRPPLNRGGLGAGRGHFSGCARFGSDWSSRWTFRPTKSCGFAGRRRPPLRAMRTKCTHPKVLHRICAYARSAGVDVTVWWKMSAPRQSEAMPSATFATWPMTSPSESDAANTRAPAKNV